MKPQTFEEWMDKNLDSVLTDPVIASRITWQAAMENAARICDDMHDPYDSYLQSPKACAESIRKAANG